MSYARLLLIPLVVSIFFLVGGVASAQTPCPAGQIRGTDGQCKPISGTGTQTAPTPGGSGTPTAPTPEADDVGLTNPLNNINSLDDLLKAILGAVVQLGTIILILALVYVGFLFVVAQGNEEKIRNAKGALLWTLIGGLILLGAEAIQLVISSTVQSL